MNWWNVVKVAVKVGLSVGRVKEAKRVQEITDAVDVVVKAAIKEGKKK